MSISLVARLVQLGQAKVWEAKAKQPRVALRPNSPSVNPNPRATVRPKNTTQNVRKSSPAQAKQTARSVPLPVINPTAPATMRPKNKTQSVRESSPAIAKQPSRSVPLPKSSVVATRLPTYKPSKNHLQANALVKGLIIAKRQKSISNAIAAKVQDVIDNLRAGKDIATAAKRSGVRIDKINELLTLAGR